MVFHPGKDTEMRKTLVVLAVIGTLMLGGCAFPPTPLSDSGTDKLAELVALCTDNGGQVTYKESHGTMSCGWKLEEGY